MDWIDPAQFKLDFEAAKNARTSQIEMAIAAAEDELVELVGQDKVTDTLLDNPTDVMRAGKLVRGHKFLSIAILLVNVNNVKVQQDTGSPVQPNRVQTSYWSPAEIKEMSEQWRQMAIKAIQPYLIVDVTGDNYDVAPEFTHPTLPSHCHTDVCQRIPCGFSL